MAILSNINNLLRISNSTGRVLINSTNAIVSNSEVLTVGGRSSLKNDSSSVATLVIVNGDATANTFQPYMYFNDGGGNRAGFGVERSTESLKINAQSNIIFSTGATSLGGTERMRINSVGTVGIGPTGTYTNNHILNLSGTGIAIKNDTNGSSNNWSQIKNTATNSGSNLTFLTATGTNVMADNGNLGIGTDSPGSKLDIGTSSGASMQFLYDTSQTYRNNISNYWNSSTDSRMDFNIGRTANVAPATIMSVGYGGNVGIGTITPLDKLTISGGTGDSSSNDAITTLTRISSTGNVLAGKIVLTAPSTYQQNMVFRIKSTASSGENPSYYTDAMTVRFDGNVGIGADSPGYKLHVNSATNNIVAIFENTETSAGIKIKNASDSGYVSTIGDDRMTVGFDVNGGATNLCITPSGNVGIGYVLPGSRLDIYSTTTFNSRTSGINVHRPGSYGQYGSFSYNSDTTYFSSTYSGNAAANYGAFIWEQFNNGTVGREAMRINTDGVIKFANTATSTGDAGSIAHYTNNYMYIRGGTGGLALGDDGFGVSIYLNNSNNIAFNTGGGTTKLSIASNGLITQTMDSTTSASTLWSQGVPSKDVWYTVFTYAQYDSVCFFAMVSFENDAGDGANQAAMFATSAGTAYGAAFGVQQISGGTGIEARRSSTSFQVRQTIGVYASSTRLNVRFISIN